MEGKGLKWGVKKGNSWWSDDFIIIMGMGNKRELRKIFVQLFQMIAYVLMYVSKPNMLCSPFFDILKIIFMGGKVAPPFKHQGIE